MRQLITVNPDGSLESLDFKRKGVDLRQFGRAEILRATEIEWDNSEQSWYVIFRNLGKLSGIRMCAVHARAAGLIIDPQLGDRTILHFDDYAEAVDMEVAVIQGLRQRSLV